MKKSELVPGRSYALKTTDTSYREGIPVCVEVSYVDAKIPGIRETKGSVIVATTWSRGDVKLRPVRPSKLWCTWDDYLERRAAYDEEEDKRVKQNSAAVGLLQEHLEMMYTSDQVWFDSARGLFHVHPDVVARLHGLPKPPPIMVYCPFSKKRIPK